MTFERTFCPSPWFHMRINNDGSYDYCRWKDRGSVNSGYDIRKLLPSQYFRQHMNEVRQAMLDGQPPLACGPCHRMEQHGKISGRQRQLLKIGVQTDNFRKTMMSSAWMTEFQGGAATDQLPQDWQIDLGNYCNSACVFCHPESSSRLAIEFQRIGLIKQLPPPNWCDDLELLERFLDDLRHCQKIRYLHFLGGETLITPAFKMILERLIQLGLHRSATVGFTTNLTVWDDAIIDLLLQFEQINLGVSIECLTPVNDYVRWPSEIDEVLSILARWQEVARQANWYMQMRITPTILTIGDLWTVYDYALANSLSVESCNFLEHPSCLRPSVLPLHMRTTVIESLQSLIIQHGNVAHDTTVINTRNPDFAHNQALQDAKSYVKYLQTQPDESYLLPDLVRYLKSLDTRRDISVIDYLPHYEQLFRSAGY